MATVNTTTPLMHDESLVLAQTYQQSMQNLKAIVVVKSVENGIVTLKPGQLTRVETQAGQHYKLRTTASDGVTLETPDDVVAVRHGDALHLRYADGSTVSFENFYAVCTDSSVCSVNLASDDAAGITLSGTNTSGGVADDGLLVYAHGNQDALMAMAQGQDSLLSALRSVADEPVITYLPPDVNLGIFALLALGIAGVASAAHSSGNSAVPANATSLTAGEIAALDAISTAAEKNTATNSGLVASVYASAGVTGVTAANLAAINSALDSQPINGIAADTTPEVQAIVDAYNAIIHSADGVGGNTVTPITAAQYTAVGVTGVSGTASAGTALFLLDDMVDNSMPGAVDTVPELQTMADAAAHVIAAAGGTATQAAAVTLTDLAALGITGATTGNLAAIEAAIQATTPDSSIDTRTELQAVVTTAIANIQPALKTISVAAEKNTAASSGLAASVYVAASVTGVTAANLAAINSALDSQPINGIAADTTPEVQAIVDAYNVIIHSADGVGGNTVTPITAVQYTAVGVTGVSGTASAGTALFLLDDMVDNSKPSAVDTVPELQTMANAAAHVIAAAGGDATQAAVVTVDDLMALGITGVNTGNLAAVQAAIQATTPDSAIDTRAELQDVVTAAITGTINIQTALDTISTAAEKNTATSSGLAASVYAAAAVTGVSGANLAAVNSALDSQPINGAAVDSTPEIQTLVNAYTAILAEANGATPNTGTPLTGMQFTSVGVTGVSGMAAAGNALFLLDDVVDNSTTVAVDTVPELQAMANAAAHVIAAAGGNDAQTTAVTADDLMALGIVGVNTGNLAAVQVAIQATTSDSAIDTQSELQAVVNAVVGTSSGPTLTSTLSGVTNLDVTSNIVLSANQVVAVGAGQIHITDMGGTGYQGDASTNTQTIDVGGAIASGLLTVSGSGASTKIVINPQWDLDLASNYKITIDDGAFVDAGGTHAAAHFSSFTFSTVTPGTHVAGTAASEAMASQTMVDATGALTAGKSWLDIQGIGNNTGSVTQLGDLSGGAYALVMKNYAAAPGGATATGGDGTDGIATHDTNVGVTNFGNNDIIYFDSQANNASTQRFDARFTSTTDGAAVGGLAGQNTLVMGLVSIPQQLGSTAMILLGLEGNTSNKIYPAIVTLDANNLGFANDWHNTSAPVIMG